MKIVQRPDERDESLYSRVKSGEMPAFDLLYARHKRGLFTYIHSYLKSPEEAEEVFHEAFMQVLKSPEVDFQGGSFKGWLYLIARNISLNRIRSRARGTEVHDLFYGAQKNTGESSAEVQILDQDFSRQIKSAIAKLPEPMSEVLTMRLTGLGYQEISKALQIPLGTVKSRFHSIVQFLKKEISQE